MERLGKVYIRDNARDVLGAQPWTDISNTICQMPCNVRSMCAHVQAVPLTQSHSGRRTTCHPFFMHLCILKQLASHPCASTWTLFPLMFHEARAPKDKTLYTPLFVRFKTCVHLLCVSTGGWFGYLLKYLLYFWT